MHIQRRKHVMRSSSTAIIVTVLLLGFSSGASVQPADAPLPIGWDKMEIESKWEVTPAQYDQLQRFFVDGSSHFGYIAQVRWNGISRRFVDNYYDTRDWQLERSGHSLRHRTRLQSQPRAGDNSVETLDRSTWEAEWEVIQYKSTPCRLDATWFRHESGACRLRDSGGQELCVAGRQFEPAEALQGVIPNHDAIASLGRDHPELNGQALRPVLNVSDYRYRVTFEKAGKEIYELSLDRLTTTDLVKGGNQASFEAELEIVSGSQTIEEVRDLLRISRSLQHTFRLKPSVHSKSGVEVKACSPS